jgi:hypothetical protein
VCYIENHQTKFTPYLLVVTKEEIKLMEFKSLDSQNLIAKNNFNLLHLKESEFKPVILEIDEVVSNIV